MASNFDIVKEAIWSDPAKVLGGEGWKGGSRRWDNGAGLGLTRTAGGSLFVQFNHGSGQAGRAAVEVFKYIAEAQGLRDDAAALEWAAGRYGISLQHSEEWAAERSKAEITAELAASFTESLRQHPDGEVGRYLQGRGFPPNTWGKWFGELTTESVKRAADTLKAKGVKDAEKKITAALTYTSGWLINGGYKLILPYFSNGVPKAILFRDITGKAEHKYIVPRGEGVKGFGWCDTLKTRQPACVVEGQLDAITLAVAGYSNVVAMGQAQPSRALVEELNKRGISDITYIPDIDFKDGQRRLDIMAGAVEVLTSAMVDGEPAFTNVYVCEMPTEDGSARKVDINDYYQQYGVDKLRETIDAESAPAWEWQTERIIERCKVGKVWRSSQLGAEIGELYLAQRNPMEAQRMKDYVECVEMRDLFRDAGISAESLTRLGDIARRKEWETRRAKLGERLAAAYEEDELRDISQSIEKHIGGGHNFAEMLALPTAESLAADNAEAAKKGKGDLKTGLYVCGKDMKDIEHFTLPSGSLTCVAMPTGHGKSTLLRNLAMSVIRLPGEGDTLYFTYEEEARVVRWQFENLYCGRRLSANNMRSIRAYYRENTTRYFTSDEDAQRFARAAAEFERQYLESGKLRIFYETKDAETLAEAIKFYNEERPVRAVFIDYAQKMSAGGHYNQRTDEIVSICNTLDRLAIELGIPIVIGSQFNRSATNPAALIPQNLADSRGLEQVVNKLLVGWNSNEAVVASDKKGENLETEAIRHRLSDRIDWGTPGKLYVRLAKNRAGIRGLEGLWSFDGNIGKIDTILPTEETISKSNVDGESVEEQDLPLN